MSRIGKQPIQIPDSVSISIENNTVSINGPHGVIQLQTLKQVSVSLEDKLLIVKPVKSSNQASMYQGLTRALLANAVHGVTEGYEKRLELVGTGYRVKKEGDKLVLSLGFSHPVVVEQEEGISLEIKGEKEIIIKGIDKQRVGQVAANIRKFREPEPYKGKGIRYKDEVVRRKAGKAAKVGSAGGGA